MELVITVNFANAEYALESEGESSTLIGYHYPIKHIDNLIFKTDKLSYCETDLYYYERKAKDPIPEGEVVEPINIWRNFYGEYLRCRYRGMQYDIKTSNIKVLTP